MPRCAHHMARFCKPESLVGCRFCGVLWALHSPPAGAEVGIHNSGMAALLSPLIFTILEPALIVGLSKLIYVAVTRGLERAMSGRSAGLLESSRRLRLRIRN